MALQKEDGFKGLRQTMQAFRAEIKIMRENFPAVLDDSVDLDSLWRTCGQLEKRFQALEEYLDKQKTR